MRQNILTPFERPDYFRQFFILVTVSQIVSFWSHLKKEIPCFAYFLSSLSAAMQQSFVILPSVQNVVM